MIKLIKRFFHIGECNIYKNPYVFGTDAWTKYAERKIGLSLEALLEECQE